MRTIIVILLALSTAACATFRHYPFETHTFGSARIQIHEDVELTPGLQAALEAIQCAIDRSPELVNKAPRALAWRVMIVHKDYVLLGSKRTCGFYQPASGFVILKDLGAPWLSDDQCLQHEFWQHRLVHVLSGYGWANPDHDKGIVRAAELSEGLARLCHDGRR